MSFNQLNDVKKHIKYNIPKNNLTGIYKQANMVCLVVCMFAWGFSSHSIIFHWNGDVIINGERLKMLIYARHSWPLSSEAILACHSHCARDTGHPFIMVISEEPWHLHLLPSVWQWSCHYIFLQLMPVVAGIRTPNPPLAW